MSRAAVHRFLADAEEAARQGDRARALDLIILALDTMPGNTEVLMRANLVRDTLSAGAETPMPPVSGVSPAASPIVPAPPAGRTRTATPAAIIILPDPVLAADFPRKKPKTALTPPLPGSRADVDAPFGMLNDEEAAAAPLPSWMDGTAAPAPTAVRPRPLVSPESFRASRRQRRARTAMAVLLGLGVLAGAALVVNPDGTRQAWGRLTDPLIKGQHCYAQRNYACALARADAVIDAGTQAADGQVLRARTLIAQHRGPEAAQSLRKALAVDDGASQHPGWQTALDVSDLQLAMGDTVSAAASAKEAWKRSAPSSEWARIAEFEILANQVEFAQFLIARLSERLAKSPGAFAPDSMRLDSVLRLHAGQTGHPPTVDPRNGPGGRAQTP